MKKWKRIISLALICARLLPIVAVNVKAESESESAANETQDSFLLAEDFSGSVKELETAGWSGISSFSLSENGELVSGKKVAYSYFTGKAEAARWTNYTVEADVTITDTAFNGASNGRFGSIMVAVPGTATSDNAYGYEFMLCRNNNDSKRYCAIKDRTGGGNNSKDVNCEINLNQTYALKIEVSGNIMQCYIDGELMITHEVPGVETLTGTIGLRGQGNQIKFDNVCVRENGLWFYEDFSGDSNDLTAAGWTNINQFNLSDGEMLLANKNNKYTYISGTRDWSNYTVEADVIVTDESLHKTANGRFAGIMLAAPADSTDAAAGYEFMICHNINDSGQYCSIKDRTGAGKHSSNINHEVAYNKIYKLKAELSGNIIRCYIDNELVLTYEAKGVEILKGTIGLHNSGNTVKFDNIIVRENVQKDSGETEEPDNSQEMWEEGMLFQENFTVNNANLAEHGWDSGKTVNLLDEKAVLNSSVSTMYVTGYEGAAEWSDYTYEAEVFMTEDILNKAQKAMVAIIAGANSDNLGYEFGILYDKVTEETFYQLYDRITGKNLTGTKKYDFSVKETITLKIVLKDNIIRCYIDDELVVTKTIENVSTIVGTIGIRANGYNGIFDNIYVYPTKEDTESGLLADTRNQDVWFSDNFKSTNTMMIERGWDTEYEIIDGKLVLSGSATATTFVTGIENVADWGNYTAEADICISDDPNETTTIGAPATGLCVRVNPNDPENTGYVFFLTIDKATDVGYARLQVRNSKTNLEENKNIVIERGKTYHLAVTVNGNRINCYIDDTLVISAVDDKNVNPTGTIGVRKSGYITYVDNVKVYKTGLQVSPITGDFNNLHMYILMLCMMASVGIGVAYYRKQKI